MGKILIPRSISKNINYIYAAAIFIFIFLLYILGAPHTVQVLDTGELVANSFTSRVIHPPGYPLYNRLFYTATHILPFGSVFFRASLFNILLSISSIFFLFKLVSKKSTHWAFIFVFPIATSSLFWKYSLLPDVFMLHMLFVSAISYFYLFPLHIKKRHVQLLFLFFALSSTNHLTTLFLFPLLFFACFRKISLKDFIIYSLASILLVTVAYSSIMLMDVDHLSSWGDIHTFKDLLKHFLRADYGTFQLHAGKKESYFFLILTSFFKHILKDYIVYFFIALSGFYFRPQITLRWIIYFICTISYITIFFYFSNIHPSRVGAEVLERFYILPLVMITFLAAAVIVHSNFSIKNRHAVIISIFFILLSVKNIFVYNQELDYSENTIIEDWAINRLNSIPVNKSKQTFLLEESDTGYASLMYVQGVLNTRPDVKIMNKFLMYYYWHSTKWLKMFPEFKFEAKKINVTRFMIMAKDLVGRNNEKFIFNIEKPFRGAEKFKTTYLALGRQLEPGTGLMFDNSSFSRIKHRIKKKPIPSLEYNQYSAYFAKYAIFYSALGKAFMSQKNQNKAFQALNAAYQIAPYSILAKNNLCIIMQQIKHKNYNKCLKELEELKTKSFNSY